MAAGQRDFGIVLTADLRAKRTRTIGRDAVVVQREDVQDRSRNGLQVDLAP